MNALEDDLVIDNYSNLESIIVKKNSLKILQSLKICNCEKLKTIEIENGEIDFEANVYFCAFWNVKNVIMDSI